MILDLKIFVGIFVLYVLLIELILDFCVGLEEEIDDIIFCIWVGYNMFGFVEIKDGVFWINGVEVRKLLDLKFY